MAKTLIKHYSFGPLNYLISFSMQSHLQFVISNTHDFKQLFFCFVFFLFSFLFISLHKKTSFSGLVLAKQVTVWLV